MKSGCSVFSANFLWSAVLQHLKRWRRSMNHLLQGTCDSNWTGSDQVTWPKLMTLKKKRSGTSGGRYLQWQWHICCAFVPLTSTYPQSPVGLRDLVDFPCSPPRIVLLGCSPSQAQSLSMSVPCRSQAHLPSSQYLPVCAFFRAALNFALQGLAAAWFMMHPVQSCARTRDIMAIHEETTLVLPS